MKNQLFFLFTFVFFCLNVSGQNCEQMLPFKQGASVTYKNYDEKEKLTGSHKQTFLKVTSEGEKVISTVKAEVFDKKEKLQNTVEYTLKCQKGLLQMDMSRMMPAGSTDMFKNMEVKMKGDDLEFPSVMSVGQSLKDGKMQMEVSNNGTSFATMNYEIVSRKVIAKETLTTSAGTFECYKISEEYMIETIITMMGMPIKMKGKSVQWYNAEVGMVKTESYKDDKLIGTTILEEIKK